MASLTAVAVKTALPGRHHDGDGLILFVKPNQSRSWVLRVMKDGKRHELGMGGFPAVSLAAARTKARETREKVKGGEDVLSAKRDAKAKRLEAGQRTFAKVAERLHADLAPGYRNAKHSAQWLSSLKAHAFPAFGSKPVAAITGPMVIDALEPIWTSTPETARRVRQRIAAVLDFAHARGWRDRAPDLKVLTKRALAPHRDQLNHHSAVEHARAAGVVAAIRSAPETIGRLALLFTIYTAGRSGEIRGATWGEVDMNALLWTIPGSRMKAKQPHTVPLSGAAFAVLEVMAGARASNDPGGLIFPGARAGKPLSVTTMAKAQSLAAPGTTVHGWRSTFSDWAGETTGFPRDVIEAALAHEFGTKSQRAYQRSKMIDKRREVMEAWANHVAALPADVVRLNTRQAGRADAREGIEASDAGVARVA